MSVFPCHAELGIAGEEHQQLDGAKISITTERSACYGQ